MIQSTRPTYWLSLDCTGIPYATLPQGSAVWGKYLARATDTGSKRVGLIWLFGNGMPVVGSLTTRATPLAWQPAPSSTLKLPASAAAVGTKALLEDGSCRISDC